MTCHHLFHHPQTPKERDAVVKQLNYCRSIGDDQGMMIVLVQLTEPCLAPESNAGGAA
ncbi:hypothetical protein [Nonomuraea sp. MG754425]|uniref:hypothetical protein n=1 Tax=Nonomuraea sp. MG754425 TaxID=2570319 RepID=UPI001F3DF585|nr:hypothetical protein [Nonomuraea sp. MG754425]